MIHLAAHLGWENMPFHVAYPALKKIVNHYRHYCIIHCYVHYSEAQAIMELLKMDSNVVFSTLCYDGTGFPVEDINNLIILRGEIEKCMINGDSVEDAMREWDIL